MANIEPVKVINTPKTDYSWQNRKAPGAEGGIVEIIVDGNVHTIKVDAQGNWSFKPGADWAEGHHTVTITYIDRASNRSNPAYFVLNVDKTAPEKPEIWRVVDNTGNDQGNLNPGAVTDEHKPVISGVAEPGTVVYLYDGEKVIGSVKADKMGAWTITPELADGEHKLTVETKDATGNISDRSDAFTITVTNGAVTSAEQEGETNVPAPLSHDAGIAAANDTSITPTNKNVIHFDTKTEPNTLVQILINNQVYTVVSDSQGKWTFTSPVLEDGTYIYQVRYMDRAGNWSKPSQRIIEIDTSAPEAPQIMRVIDNEGDINYLSPNDYTNDKTPTLTGVAQPGSTVYIYGAGKDPIGSVKAGNDGRWTFTPELNTDGTYVFSAAYEDRFGRMSPKSDNFTLNLDASVPSEPSLDVVYDDEGRVTGPLKSGDTTDDKTPTLSGEADAGSIVRIWDGEKIIASTIANSRGKWQIELDLEEGEHSLRVDSISKGGTTSGKTDPFKLIIDTKVLPTPVIDEMVANNGDKEVPLKSGDSTNDETPVLRGGGNDGDIVYVVVDGDTKNPVASTVVKDGKWQIELPAQKEGDHELSVIVQDPKTGSISQPSDPVKLIIDLTPPEQPKQPGMIDNEGENTGPVVPGKPTDDNRPGFEGENGDAGDSVEVIIIDKDGNKQVIGTGTVGEDGKWTVRPDQPIPDGEYDVEIIVTDPAGNKSDPSDPIKLIIDTKAPAPVSSVELIDDQGPITGPIRSGDVTDDSKPTLQGQGESGSQVIVYLDGKEVARVDVKDGKWSYEFPALAEGGHKVEVQPVSQAGVKGDKETVVDFNVDTTGPVAVPGGADANFTGVFEDNMGSEVPARPDTNDQTLIFKGKGSEDGSVVMIWGDAARTLLIGTAVVENGEWRFESDVLPEQVYDFNVTVRDAAGNELVIDKTVVVRVDVTPPDAPEIDSFSVNGFTDVEGMMTMSLNDILAQGNDSLFIDNGKSQVIVSGNAGDDVKLEDILPKGEDISNWNQANGTVTVAGVEYNVYQNTAGDAEVLVQNNLHNEQH